ncbi:MAG: DUF2330 domain-containing protein [Kofleriaceae bacterium]|nr:DUF2330 domain-containing protein [Kofleriaceae bacterium]
MPRSRLPRAALAAAALAATATAVAVPGRAAAVPATVCCGAYVAPSEGVRLNDALHLVVVRDGTRTFVTLQNHYRGPIEDFALLVPVPSVLQADDVKTLDPSVFDAVTLVTAPSLTAYDEIDPCWEPDPDDDGKSGAGAPGGGRGGDAVTVEASFVVGEYQVEVLSSTDATALDAWLHGHGYRVPDALAPLLRPYVESGSKFFVAKVDPTKVTFVDGVATLSPLRFRYDADELSLPLRLSAANSPGIQDVLVHVFAPARRYEAANRPNVTIPTDVELTEAAALDFGGFYGALFARVLAPEPRAVVTEYAAEAYPWRLHDPMIALGVDADRTGDHWVVTRLHLQVDRDGPLDDLLLREAGPVESLLAASYAVRHPWTGKVGCLMPHYGRWRPAPDLAPLTAYHASDRPLEELVAADIPSLGVKAAHPRPAPPVAATAAGPTAAKKKGCGCASTGDGGAASGLALAVAALAAARPLRRRRRRRACAGRRGPG